MPEPSSPASRRVAILGSGGIGRGTAALLASRGHVSVLWSPRGQAAGLGAGDGMAVTGRLSGPVPVTVARSCAEAVAGADAVIVAVVGNGHRAVLDALAACLAPEQHAIISAHLSFGALYLARKLAERGMAAPVSAWGTTVVTARRSGPNSVHVSGVRERLDVATLPASRAADGLALCRALFGDRFDPAPDLLAIMLSNLNPPSHMANMLLNLTRAEKGEDWPNYGGITPAVGTLMEALDAERLAVARAFGLRVRTVFDHFVLTHGIPAASVADMAAAVHARRPELKGPTTLDTRFVTEDVPFGLVPLSFIGRIAGVPTPLHDGGTAILSAVYRRDFAAENDLLPGLGLEGLGREAFHALLRDGPAAPR